MAWMFFGSSVKMVFLKNGVLMITVPTRRPTRR